MMIRSAVGTLPCQTLTALLRGKILTFNLDPFYRARSQAALLEGMFTVQTVHKFIVSGKTEGKVYRAPGDPDSIPEAKGIPARFNFIPNPPVRSDEIDTTRLWGYRFDQLATY